MQLLRLLTKVALIFNGCFLVATCLRFTTRLPASELSGLIIIAGYFLSVATSIVLNAWLLAYWLRYRSPPPGVAQWIIAVNLVFLVLEVIYFRG